MINLKCDAVLPECDMKPLEDIENSITAEYKKSIWAKFLKAVNEFGLVKDGDKIAIAISGGKDSLLLYKLFQRLKKDKRRNFEFRAVNLNPGFKKEDLDNFKNNLLKLDIDCEIFDTNIWKIANEKAKDYPCFLCAKMRRGILYKKVEEYGYNKLALGHHFDDVIETTLINIFYSGSVKTMTPEVDSTSGKLKVIRPLIYVEEKDIINYTKKNGILAMNCGCTIEAGKTSSKRKEVKDLLSDLEEKHPGIKKSVFNSMRNINLNYVYGYEKEKEKNL
ncbi:tRNA 2-thiocytidine biosynthesis protein TtcA [Sebaldella termitidis]|jgi:tRNA 2-thiocytidine biosynthesis protein TtcA|uniref:PP-loop domain protein n=1 Tax=Sebaldella termitidis (strain ATCC 33386 / NCTC 11300) TaxID=526218 RepID=D1AP34_SEBTE|nr:tRNA 2-thiocytidine(32) synthetase TtcA [Sebaldella termitidis]ACZ07508.1 PP-loop domain protein [Sebaldella termitidis ATCC 33386]MBP7979049.1 tRNA 2-thiocytidine(32) synthetase TtcA [Sebaldella sp.]SUI22803.1 tRNA 2-thiocytidine biosynthesis protein TtcA [Sebaldella termitidis]